VNADEKKLATMVMDMADALGLGDESGPLFPDPFATQVGGDHYKNLRIQPAEYIEANGLSFLEGCIVKRITRWRSKDGLRDLEKIKHEVDLLIELDKKYPRTK
jgi:TATA-binding protein-associated factor Taf7